MAKRLRGTRIAVLFTDGVEQVEFTESTRALREAGATVTVVAPHGGKIRAWNRTDWGKKIDVDQPLGQTDTARFDALLLPGGVMNIDSLRMIPAAVDFVSRMFADGKPIAATCHAPWMLVEAGLARGRSLTSWPSLQADIRNASGHWVDQEVVDDDGIVTSRDPNDLPVFNQLMIDVIARSQNHRRETVRADRLIDEAIAESFPASDPPSWNPGHASAHDESND